MPEKFTTPFLFFLLFPFLVNASAYWMELKGRGKINEEVRVELIYGNIDELGIRHRQQAKELELAGNFRFTLVTPSGESIKLKLTKGTDSWHFSFVPKLEGTYQLTGINDSHPVIDRSNTGGENVLPVDYLCTQYQVGHETTPFKPLQFLDIGLTRDQKLISIKAFQNNLPSKTGTKLRVFNPHNWEKELTLNEKGEAAFHIDLPGMYVIRQDFLQLKSGTYQGISYTSIRYRCNNCLFIVE